MTWLLALRVVLLALTVVFTFGIVARSLHHIGSSAATMLLWGFSLAGFVASMGWLG